MTKEKNTDARFPALYERTALQRQVADEIASGPRGRVGGAFVVLLHNPALASHLQKLGAHLRFETSLSDDLRAIAILVTSAHWRCDYEWDAHSRLALSRGLLNEEAIESIGQQKLPDDFNEVQANVFRFCLAMHRDGRVTDNEFGWLSHSLGNEGVLDLIALCGYFALLAMVLNVSKHPIPDGRLGRFSSEADAIASKEGTYDE